MKIKCSMKKERSKSRSIQSELLRIVEGFVSDKTKRPHLTNDEWNLIGKGDKIEDYEFTNEAIKSLLARYYKNKGNPFTQVKIDSRGDLGEYLIEKNYTIIHTSGGHVFSKGISNNFGDFPNDERRKVTINHSVNHNLIKSAELLKHSSAEGVFLGAALFMEEQRIRDFLEIPKNAKMALIPSHRRKYNSIQVEIDSMLIWFYNNQIYIAVFEIKSDSKKKPDWSGGFSYHQVRNTANTIAARFDNNIRQKTTIIPVYFRAEWNKRSDLWTAKLDMFDELVSNESVPKITKSLDLIGLPR